MKTHRFFALIVMMSLLVGETGVCAQPPKVIEPNEEQLATAIKAFEALGGRLKKSADYHNKHNLFIFVMPNAMNDGHLKKIPKVPFSFWLSLSDTEVTDGGLKELANLKNLSGLNLSNTKLTDEGMKELANLKNLSWLYIGSTLVTDQGELVKPSVGSRLQP